MKKLKNIEEIYKKYNFEPGNAFNWFIKNDNTSFENAKNNRLFIEAEFTVDKEVQVLKSISIENCNAVCASIIGYVKKTKNPFLKWKRFI